MRVDAAAYARALLDRLGVHGVPGVSGIAGALGLTIKEGDVEGFDGALIRVKGTNMGVIALRRSIRELGRKHFTVAHEIGHFVLPRHEEGAVCGSDQVEHWSSGLPLQELEANDFAGELLMPEPILRSSIGSPEPSFRVVEAITRIFAVSLTAAAYRFSELTSFRCAVVWSLRRQVRWFKASKEFEHWVRIRDEVDRRTFAFDAYQGKPTPDHAEAVPADAWLQSTQLKQNAYVFEESRYLPYYDAVLTLLWIKDAIETDPNEVDAALEPLDPEEFSLRRRRWPGKR